MSKEELESVKIREEIALFKAQRLHLVKPEWKRPAVVVPWVLATVTLSIGFLTGSIQTSLANLEFLREQVGESQEKLNQEQAQLKLGELEIKVREIELKENQDRLDTKEAQLQARLSNIEALQRLVVIVESMHEYQDQDSFRQPCHTLINLLAGDSDGVAINELREIGRSDQVGDAVVRSHLLGVVAHVSDLEGDWTAFHAFLASEQARGSSYAHHVCFGPIDWGDTQTTKVIEILADLVTENDSDHDLRGRLYWRLIPLLEKARRINSESDRDAITLAWETQLILLTDARDWYLDSIRTGDAVLEPPIEPLALLESLMPSVIEIIVSAARKVAEEEGRDPGAIISIGREYANSPGLGSPLVAPNATWSGWSAENRYLIDAVLEGNLTTLRDNPSLASRLFPLPRN